MGRFLEFTKETWSADFEVVKRNELHKFVVLPKRWIVERTNAWIVCYRRLAKDFKRYAKTVRTSILLAMTRLMVKRLSKTYGTFQTGSEAILGLHFKRQEQKQNGQLPFY